MKVKGMSFGVAVVFGIVCILSAVAQASQPPKYVFLFIGDGMGTAQRMAADEFLKHQGKEGLIMNTFPAYGMSTTYQNDRFITDSAAAATAQATGVKTNGGYISVDPEFNPVETIAEKAKKSGMMVGIVSSVSIDHATPACFYAHQKSRNMYHEIDMDLANSGFDYFGGGGLKDPEGKKSKEPQGNALEVAKNNGYTIAVGKEAFMALNKESGKVIAYNDRLDKSKALPYIIDTVETDITLTEFTQKGIELLENPKGFFMMVEGGKIDWTCHANDAATAIQNTLEFDRALKTAYEFYRAHPEETLIVVTGDHETGGLTLGFAGTRYDSFFDVLKVQKVSYDVFSSEIFKGYKEGLEGKANFEDVIPLLKEYFGLEIAGEGNLVLKDYELQALRDAYVQSLAGVKVNTGTADYLLYGGYDPFTVQITHIFNQKAGLGWTSYSHTGVPVPISAIGVGAETFNGFYDNTDIGKKIMEIMGFEFKVAALN
jgi:alkaline phosphatase